MYFKFSLKWSLLTLIISGSSIASEQTQVPKSGFFLGVGGSGSAVSFYNQRVYGKGTSYSPPYGTHTAQTGSAQGSTGLDLDSQFSLSPIIQAGYYDQISNSLWFKGAKFFYSYLGSSSEKNNLTIPQAGGYNEDGTYTPFTGNYLVQSYRQAVIQQMSLIPFLGRTFEKSQIYFGLGPMTAQTKTSIENITGFENIYIIPTTPTGIGLGNTYKTTQWLFGGVAMVGTSYFIDPAWFIDISYSYSITGRLSSDWGGAWQDTDIKRSNVSRNGTNSGTTTGSINTQFFAITINKLF